ncbi:MAG: hypothetical protein UW85_C0018G0009 [Parcubacteria group bacterium GW2011_GWA1_Parcubacteria_45_10]|nr:MAG: hypothetical protein UW85_C0018G0009 [Parcubacteria group bacterium GW2011_GWA1_Parcubacteria_45_10]
MRKGISRNKFSWKNVLKGVGIFAGGVILVAIIAFGVYEARVSSRDERLSEMETTLKLIQDRLFEKQNAGIYGGKTPAETIYLYYEFLESRLFGVISTYFVPEKRAEEFKRYDGVSEKEILEFVEELRAAEVLARSADVNVSEFKMTSPVDLGLKKMANGVWEFEYINRKLK